MDKELFVRITDGAIMHFWGDDCLLVDDRGKIYKFSDVYVDILELCDGSLRIEDIVNKILHEYNCPVELYNDAQDKVLQMLKYLIKNRVIVESCVKPTLIKFSGERGKYYPQSINIELTNRCNFNCAHCYKGANSNGTDISEEAMDYIYELLKGKTRFVQFSGGEPLLNHNISKYVVKFGSDFDLSLVTNGSVFNILPNEVAMKFSSVQFSLYGYSANTCAEFTHNSRAYSGIKSAVIKANQLNLNYQLCVTLGRDAIDKMEDYIKFCITIGVKKLKFGLPAAVGRAQLGISSSQYLLSKENINYAYKKLRGLKLKYKDDIYITLWGHVNFRNNQAENNIYGNDNLISCGAGSYTYVISQFGHIRPCEFLPEEKFDMGDLSIINDYINGDFHNSELKNKVASYRKELLNKNISLYSICSSLEPYYQSSYKEKN